MTGQWTLRRSTSPKTHHLPGIISRTPTNQQSENALFTALILVIRCWAFKGAWAEMSQTQQTRFQFRCAMFFESLAIMNIFIATLLTSWGRMASSCEVRRVL